MSRVLLLVDREEDRRLLSDWLTSDYEVFDSADRPLDEPFDICLLDIAALRHHASTLARRKRRTEPVFLPYLLLVPETHLQRFGANVVDHVERALREQTDEFDASVDIDELVSMPTNKAVLGRHIEQLLRTRTLSLELEEQKDQYSTLLEVTPETIGVLVDGVLEYVNDAGVTLLGAGSRDDLLGVSLLDFVHADDRTRLERLLDGGPSYRDGGDGGFGGDGGSGGSGGDDGDGGGGGRDRRDDFVELRLVGYGGDVRTVELRETAIQYEGESALQVVIRDVTNRKRREEELESQQTELEQLNRLNEVIRDIGRDLVAAETRERIEQSVCDSLTALDTYLFAWIGSYDARNQRLVPRASSGNGDEQLDGLDLAERTTDSGPVGAAVATEQVQVARNILHVRERDLETWRERALERGFRSAVAVPVRYRHTLYGVLTVYADRPNAFDDRAAEVLAELGELIGHGVNAIDRKWALVADSGTEIEFSVADRSQFLAGASEETGCRLAVEEVVPQEDGEVLNYVRATNGDLDALVDLAADAPEVASVRTIRQRGGDALLEVMFRAQPVVTTLAAHGATVTGVTAVDGTCTVTAVLPRDADVRAVADAFLTTVPESAVTARRSATRDHGQPWTDRETLVEDLTEKQRTTLRAAYLAGFFNQPRTSTGEEVAASLGVSPSTFHQHLRVALRKLLAAVFDETTVRP